MIKFIPLNLLTIQDHFGDTALHDAARFGHLVCVKHLIGGGANPAIRNKNGTFFLLKKNQILNPVIFRLFYLLS